MVFHSPRVGWLDTRRAYWSTPSAHRVLGEMYAMCEFRAVGESNSPPRQVIYDGHLRAPWEPRNSSLRPYDTAGPTSHCTSLMAHAQLTCSLPLHFPISRPGDITPGKVAGDAERHWIERRQNDTGWIELMLPVCTLLLLVSTLQHDRNAAMWEHQGGSNERCGWALPSGFVCVCVRVVHAFEVETKPAAAAFEQMVFLFSFFLSLLSRRSRAEGVKKQGRSSRASHRPPCARRVGVLGSPT